MTQPLSWNLHGNDQLSGLLEKLDRTLSKLSSTLDRVTGDAKRMGRSLGETENAAARAGRGLDGVSSRSEHASGKIAALGSKLASFAATAGLALGAAGLAATGFGIKMAAANETAAISFEVLLGSAEKSAAFLQKLHTFAAATPFEMPELRDAASRLLAVGVNASKVIPLLTRVGDATSGMGTGAEGIGRAVYAMQQVFASGVAQMDDLNQLSDAGIPIMDALAAHFGVTVRKLRKELVPKGKVTAADLFGAIEQGEGPAFKRLNGMMTRQSATLAGIWSTFKGNAGQSLATFAEPAIPALKRLVDAAGKAVPTTIAKLQDMGKEASGIFKGSDVPDKFMNSVRELGNKLMPELKGAWDGLLETVRNNKEGLEEFGRFCTDILIPLLGEGLVVSIKTVATTLDLVVWTLSHSVPVIKIFAGTFLTMIGLILGAAVTGFGWIPELGPKLKTAEADFARFSKGVMDKLNALDGKHVDLYIDVHGIHNSEEARNVLLGHRAAGGPVWKGERYRVGENGPEEFYATQTGVIRSNDSLRNDSGGGGGVIGVLRVIHETPDGTVIREELLSLKRRRNLATLGF